MENKVTEDLVTDFLYYNPIHDHVPNNKVRIGVEFEVGGVHEGWGFVIDYEGERYAEGSTLEEAIANARKKYKKLMNKPIK